MYVALDEAYWERNKDLGEAIVDLHEAMADELFERGMHAVEATQQPIPSGYEFAAFGVATYSKPIEVQVPEHIISAISHSVGPAMRVVHAYARLEHPDRANLSLERSIWLMDKRKKVAFLNGKDTPFLPPDMQAWAQNLMQVARSYVSK